MNNEAKLKVIILAKTKEVTSALNIKANDAPMHKIEEFIYLLITLNAINNFVDLCENSIDRAGFEYKNGWQRFLSLKKDYENKVVNKILENKMSKFELQAHKLAQKVKNISATYEESERKRLTGLTNYKQLTFKNFGDYFSSEDLAILSIVGNIAKCISLQDSVSGADQLEDKIFSMLSKKEMIGAKKIFRIGTQEPKQIDSRVMGLISEIKKT